MSIFSFQELRKTGEIHFIRYSRTANEDRRRLYFRLSRLHQKQSRKLVITGVDIVRHEAAQRIGLAFGNICGFLEALRQIIKNRGSFPSDNALLKLFYLALRNISPKWTMPIRDWKASLTRFTIQFDDRMTQY